MQLAIIEFARIVGLKDANSTEFDRATNHPVIALITEWQDLARGQQVRDEKSELGGSMRLGAQEARLKPGSLVHSLYGKESIFERHRHRYEFNNHYLRRVGCGRHDFLGILRRRAGRIHRARLPSVVCRESVPSGVHLDAARRPSAVHGIRPSGARLSRIAAAGSRHRMKLASFEVGADQPFFLIAGPCVVESEALVIDVAGRLSDITETLGIPFIFKASFDKANRSSRSSFRGPGIEKGLEALARVRKQIGVPVLTDVHEDTPLAEVAEVVDVLQTPAFLCRQTNFIVAACSQGKPVNIKKGQFLRPWEMQNVVDKARSTGNAQIMVCERGFSFGYNNLVSDMRSLASCAPPAVPWSSMPRTLCSCRAARETLRGGSANSFRCWRAPRWPPASRGFSWRPIRTRPRRYRTGPTRGRWIAWAHCSTTLVELDLAVKKKPFEESLL